MSDGPSTDGIGDWRYRISRRPDVLPDVLSGEPSVRDLNVLVRQLFVALARGSTPERILRDHPGLELADLHACFAYAAEVLAVAAPVRELSASEAETLPPQVVPADLAETVAPACHAAVPAASVEGVHIPGYEIL